MANKKHPGSVFEEDDEPKEGEDPRDPPRSDPEPEPDPDPQLLLEEVRFVCRTQCYWRGKLWHVGDQLLLAPGGTAPRHFEQVK